MTPREYLRTLERRLRAARRVAVVALGSQATRKANSEIRMLEGQIAQWARSHGLRRAPERETA